LIPGFDRAPSLSKSKLSRVADGSSFAAAKPMEDSYGDLSPELASQARCSWATRIPESRGNMAVTVDIQEGTRYIRLTGSLDIAHAAELKRVLVDAIPSSPRVCIEVAGVSAIDVTIVQLLWAAVSYAKSAGLDLILEGPVSEAAAKSLALTGIFPLMASLVVRSGEEAGNVLISRN
jgi:anti-anti-sigma factor